MIRFEETVKLQKFFASRVLYRCKAAGAHTIQIEDIESECAIAWCKARDAWKPDSGTKFSGFLMTGMKRHINRWLEKEIPNSTRVSLDAGGSEDDDLMLYNVVADPTALPPDEHLQISQTRQKTLGRLKPDTKQVLELLENAPPELLAEVSAVQSRALYGRSRGLAPTKVKDLTLTMVFDLLGYDNARIGRVREDLKKAVARVNALKG